MVISVSWGMGQLWEVLLCALLNNLYPIVIKISFSWNKMLFHGSLKQEEIFLYFSLTNSDTIPFIIGKRTFREVKSIQEL